MNDPFPYLIYVFFLILYIIFFSHLFNKNLEYLMFILIFILSIFSGVKTVSDIYNSNILFKFDVLDSFVNKIGFFKIIKNILFSTIVIILVGISMLVNIVLYAVKQTVPLSSVISHIFVLFTLIAYRLFYNVSIPLWGIVIIPILLIFVSFIFILITIHNLKKNKDDDNNEIRVSKNTRKKLNIYKGLYITDAILLNMYMVIALFYNKEEVTQLATYLIMPIVYGTSGYMVYLANKLSDVKSISK
jgi:hypothetical protein